MEQGQAAAVRGPTAVSKRASIDGPVWPTSTAWAQLSPLGLGEVTLAEGFQLGDWQRRNSTRTIPHCIARVVSSGVVRNLELVAEQRAGEEPHHGLHFADSDIYKTLEACSWDSLRG